MSKNLCDTCRLFGYDIDCRECECDYIPDTQTSCTEYLVLNRGDAMRNCNNQKLAQWLVNNGIALKDKQTSTVDEWLRWLNRREK